MATALRWIPDTLYNYSLAAVVANYDVYQKDTQSFPENMLFDICYQLYKESHLKKLSIEFSNLQVFRKLLKVKDKRCLLHNCFQAVMDYGFPVASHLAEAFQTLSSNACNSKKNNAIKLGFLLGTFLLDAGWFSESDIVFSACLSLCYSYDSPSIWKCILQCHTKLLSIRNLCCKFEEGKETYREANECIEKIRELGLEENFACIYSEFSHYYSVLHNYDETYRWSIKALKELNLSLFPEDIVNVLCQASKACIFKREHKRSELLIKQALRIAKNECGARNLCFASALEDYGYHLINNDAVGPAVKAYQTVLSLRMCIFGGNNLLVARCHGDLAYACYSYEYSSGHFKDALDHAEKALSIMHNLLNDHNFLLASVKRAKALILEEIALNCQDLILQNKYFHEALELHTYVLQYARQIFGELNIYTAKHFGNLGRLFQSMKRYKEAQDMHLKSIAIKEEILGPDDYEVGMSAGFLASLYTYDMELHKEAEALFLRSIEISRKLFGQSFSGLEYDYRGLLRVYTKLGQSDKVLEYRLILHNWKMARDQVFQKESEFSPLSIETDLIAPEDIMKCFKSVQ